MPDIHAVPESSTRKEASAKWVNSNLVLQKALQQSGHTGRDHLILRCDDLPSVYGQEEDLQRLFSCLLQMILEKQDTLQKLFLHIHCTAEEQVVTTPSRSNYYSIQFSTSVSPSAEWLLASEQYIADATVILKALGGSFVVNQEANGSCLFSVSLPGKFL